MNRLEITKFPPLDYASTEAMNTLCTNISYCGNDIKTIMITSRYAMEGKSYVAMNLLRGAAGLKKRVVLLDADLRRSGIAGCYGLRFPQKDSKGLAHYLAGMCEIDDVLYETDIEDAFLIPAGREVVSSLQLLASPLMELLMRELAERFDMVLVDTPPAGVIVDAVEIAKHCDGALLVVSYNRGRKQDVTEVTKMIQKTGCRVLGATLNNVEMRSIGNRKYYYRSGYDNKYNRSE